MNQRCWSRAFIALACLTSFSFIAPAAHSAATVLIWPIDPILTADKNATALWIENQGASATTMQVRIVRW